MVQVLLLWLKGGVLEFVAHKWLGTCWLMLLQNAGCFSMEKSEERQSVFWAQPSRSLFTITHMAMSWEPEWANKGMEERADTDTGTGKRGSVGPHWMEMQKQQPGSSMHLFYTSESRRWDYWNSWPRRQVYVYSWLRRCVYYIQLNEEVVYVHSWMRRRV